MSSSIFLISFSPNQYDPAVDPTINIVLRFSGPVKAGTGRFVLYDSETGLLLSEPMSGNLVTFSGNTVTIDPQQDFRHSARIIVSFTDGWLVDSDGAAIRADSFDFRTVISPSAVNEQGTDMADFLHGSYLADHLSGNGGDDKIWGYGGNDVLSGGAGDDTLTASWGGSTLSGGDGNDSIYVSGGSNRVDGGQGDDLINASNIDNVVAGDGHDTIRLGAKRGASAGSADGGAGDDKFEVELSGSLSLSGGSGSDIYLLKESVYTNEASRCAINDFEAGAGGDQLDLAWLVKSNRGSASNPFAPDGFLRLQADGSDTLLVLKDDGEITLLRLKNVTPEQLTKDNFVGGYRPDGSNQGLVQQGSDGNDELNGSELDDELSGGSGNDLLLGARGSDSLRGDAGDDNLRGGEGTDLLEGGVGNDTLSGDEGNDVLKGGIGIDILYGGEGNDVLEGGGGDDVLDDRLGDNILRGGIGNDRINVGGRTFAADGSVGDDILSAWIGGSGTMSGGFGNDEFYVKTDHTYGIYDGAIRLDGGDGDDNFTITGEYGRVTIEAGGGAGRDTFDLRSTGDNKITISDFTVGSGGDRIEVNGVLPYGFQQNPFGSSGYLRLRQAGQDTILEFDRDGAAGAKYGWRDLATFTNTSAVGFTGDNFKTLAGGDNNDELYGDLLDNTLEGRGGNDTLYGGAGKDLLRGGDGDDRLDGGDGNDHIDGGAGLDIVQMARARTDVKIWADGGWIKVQDLTGSGGTDTLADVERLQLDGSTVAFDSDGVGGQIYRLYQAAFNRQPDKTGLGFWIHQADRGESRVSIAESFVASDEFKKLYGEAPTNEYLVERLYFNVLHREPDDEGRAFWLDVLDRKLAPLSSVLVGFSESKENTANLASVIGSGFEYTPWLG